MPEYKKLRRIIDNLARDWIFHYGVVNVTYEKIDGKFYVVFEVKFSEMVKPEFDYEIYPRTVKGFKTIIKPVRG